MHMAWLVRELGAGNVVTLNSSSGESLRLGPREPRVGVVTAGQRTDKIVELMAQGLQAKEIAAQLGIAPRTVKAHLNRRYAARGWSEDYLKCVVESLHVTPVPKVKEITSVRLTPREWVIAREAACGYKGRVLAKRLHTTYHVTRNYLRSIYDKVGVSTRLELSLWYYHHKDPGAGLS